MKYQKVKGGHYVGLSDNFNKGDKVIYRGLIYPVEKRNKVWLKLTGLGELICPRLVKKVECSTSKQISEKSIPSIYLEALKNKEKTHREK